MTAKHLDPHLPRECRALLAAALTALYLRRRYLSLPLVREKHRLQAESSALSTRIAALDAQLAKAQRDQAALPAEQQAAVDRRQAAHQAHLADLDRRRADLPRREEQDVAALRETIRLMAEIDALIPAWPLQ